MISRSIGDGVAWNATKANSGTKERPQSMTEEKMDTASRNGGETCAATLKGAATEAAPDVIEAAVVKFLARAQAKDLRKDDGHGYRSARLIAQAVGMETKDCRDLLRSMAERGLVRFTECLNGLFWRSTIPLPWETGGELAIRWAAEEAAWKQPLTLIVQAIRRDRDGTSARDEKAYPAALRDQAEARVRHLNALSEYQRDCDRRNDCHLSAGYASPPSYRLVEVHSVDTAKATGETDPAISLTTEG